MDYPNCFRIYPLLHTQQSPQGITDAFRSDFPLHLVDWLGSLALNSTDYPSRLQLLYRRHVLNPFIHNTGLARLGNGTLVYSRGDHFRHKAFEAPKQDAAEIVRSWCRSLISSHIHERINCAQAIAVFPSKTLNQAERKVDIRHLLASCGEKSAAQCRSDVSADIIAPEAVGTSTTSKLAHTEKDAARQKNSMSDML